MLLLCVCVSQGEPLSGQLVSGALCLARPWPGMARSIFRDHQRFIDAYFTPYPGQCVCVLTMCAYVRYHCVCVCVSAAVVSLRLLFHWGRGAPLRGWLLPDHGANG